MTMMHFILLFLFVVGVSSSAHAAQAVWIDTDAACDGGWFRDVDDCWALVQAFQSRSLRIRGISSTFGNADIDTTDSATRNLVSQLKNISSQPHHHPKVYRGASRAERNNTEASAALASALGKEKLTIVALGPLSNIATMLVRLPHLASHITKIVAVAGTRPNARHLYGRNRSLLHFHDENFRKDPEAFETVLRAGVPIVLIPFEASSTVVLNRDHLREIVLAQPSLLWLASKSEAWLRFSSIWLGIEGFRPFDSLAIAWLGDQDLFSCELLHATIQRERSLMFSRDALVVSDRRLDSPLVTYCSRVASHLAEDLVARLTDR